MQARSTWRAVAQTFLAFVAAGGFATLAAGGCNMVSGLDSLTQAATLDDGGLADGSTSGGPQGTGGDGGVVGGPTTSTCTPDPTFCNTHCGNAKDNCGQPRTCGECGASETCDSTTNTCQCAVAPNFCSGRCGTATDNCTHQENCGGCEAGVCSAGGACGCDPDPVATTCGSQKCGQTTNNCHQTVFCGVGGTANCATAGDVCESSTNTCCTPNNTAACAGKCNENVVNNCGQTIGCPATCTSGEVCDGTSCCTPESEATTCGSSCGVVKTNNCGQQVSCGCTGSGQVCASGSCCTPTDVCTNGHECGTGVNNCGQSISCGLCDFCSGGGICNATTGVCTCRCGVQPLSADGLSTEIVPCP